jgi:hypothetical protein
MPSETIMISHIHVLNMVTMKIYINCHNKCLVIGKKCCYSSLSNEVLSLVLISIIMYVSVSSVNIMPWKRKSGEALHNITTSIPDET